jgi:hypothetical protein
MAGMPIGHCRARYREEAMSRGRAAFWTACGYVVHVCGSCYPANAARALHHVFNWRHHRLFASHAELLCSAVCTS